MCGCWWSRWTLPRCPLHHCRRVGFLCHHQAAEVTPRKPPGNEELLSGRPSQRSRQPWRQSGHTAAHASRRALKRSLRSSSQVAASECCHGATMYCRRLLATAKTLPHRRHILASHHHWLSHLLSNALQHMCSRFQPGSQRIVMRWRQPHLHLSFNGQPHRQRCSSSRMPASRRSQAAWQVLWTPTQLWTKACCRSCPLHSLHTRGILRSMQALAPWQSVLCLSPSRMLQEIHSPPSLESSGMLFCSCCCLTLDDKVGLMLQCLPKQPSCTTITTSLFHANPCRALNSPDTGLHVQTNLITCRRAYHSAMSVKQPCRHCMQAEGSGGSGGGMHGWFMILNAEHRSHLHCALSTLWQTCRRCGPQRCPRRFCVLRSL